MNMKALHTLGRLKYITIIKTINNQYQDIITLKATWDLLEFLIRTALLPCFPGSSFAFKLIQKIKKKKEKTKPESN